MFSYFFDFLYVFTDTNPLLVLSAVIPAVMLLVLIYRLDKLEREPVRLLLQLIGLGVLSTGMAFVTESIGDTIMDALWEADAIHTVHGYYFLYFFFVVAVSEEGFKYLMLWLRTRRCADFNCQFDGVVYATFVSLGFALAENITYVAQYGFGTAIIRALTAVPGHTCFGVFMGVWYGFAKKYELLGLKKKARRTRFVGVLLATAIHGAYDYIATCEEAIYTVVFILFVLIMFLISFLMIKSMAKADQYIQ